MRLISKKEFLAGELKRDINYYNKEFGKRYFNSRDDVWNDTTDEDTIFVEEGRDDKLTYTVFEKRWLRGMNNLMKKIGPALGAWGFEDVLDLYLRNEKIKKIREKISDEKRNF